MAEVRMIRLRKIIRGVAAITAVAALTMTNFTGCSKESSKNTDSSSGFSPRLNTETSVIINVVGNYDNFPSLEQVGSDFKKYYPNVTINYSKVDDYINVMDTLLTDNPDVDIFMANNTNIKNNETVKSIAVNLSDESLGFDLTALDSGVYESAKSEDGLYRLPLYSIANGLIVNKDLLKKYNLEVPTNYSEFVHCCEVLKAAGLTPIYGYDSETKKATNLSQGLYGSLVMTKAAKKNTNNSISTALNALESGSEQVYLEALEEVESFRKLGFYSRESNSSITDNYEKAILRFFEGDVAFLTATTETMSGTAKRESKSEKFSAEPFEYTFIATPLGENGAYIYVNSSAGLAINKNGANKDYAIEFLRFYCQVDELNASADAKGMLSTSCKSRSAAAFPDFAMDNAEYVSYISDFYLESKPSKTINEIIRLVSDEGVSASEALGRYQEIISGY